MRLKVPAAVGAADPLKREPPSEADADDEAHRLGLPLEREQRLLPGSRKPGTGV